MEPAAVQQIVASLRELHELGRPKTDEEVEALLNKLMADTDGKLSALLKG